MRQLLGILRAPGTDDNRPAPRLSDIGRLVEGLRAGGLDVALVLDAVLDPQDLAPGLELCAYRVIQEALTNAVKHSPGSPVAVTVRVSGQLLDVRVESRGRRPGEGGGTGSGLDGISARVAAAGGTSRIGPTESGWLVHAELPL
jgi:signal transduction histidine kinase